LSAAKTEKTSEPIEKGKKVLFIDATVLALRHIGSCIAAALVNSILAVAILSVYGFINFLLKQTGFEDLDRRIPAVVGIVVMVCSGGVFLVTASIARALTTLSSWRVRRNHFFTAAIAANGSLVLVNFGGGIEVVGLTIAFMALPTIAMVYTFGALTGLLFKNQAPEPVEILTC
jgi:hypothetical protein